MAEKTIHVVTRAANGSLRTKEFTSFDEIEALHDKIGIDDCSTDLTLRGMPVFRGLIGPIPESSTTVRYESPEVFEVLTKEWTAAKTKRRRRRTSSQVEADKAAAEAKKNAMPAPNMVMPGTISPNISTPSTNV